MKEMRENLGGFISINRSERLLIGGAKIDFEGVIKAFQFINMVIDVFNGYKKDFLRGYQNGLKGNKFIF